MVQQIISQLTEGWRGLDWMQHVFVKTYNWVSGVQSAAVILCRRLTLDKQILHLRHGMTFFHTKKKIIGILIVKT